VAHWVHYEPLVENWFNGGRGKLAPPTTGADDLQFDVQVVGQIWNMLRIFRIETFLKGDIGRTTTECRKGSAGCGG
jgi:hypothetical protein